MTLSVGACLCKSCSNMACLMLAVIKDSLCAVLHCASTYDRLENFRFVCTLGPITMWGSVYPAVPVTTLFVRMGVRYDVCFTSVS